MNYVEPKDLEAGKCYALVTDSQVFQVIKILSVNLGTIKAQSMYLRSHDYGFFEEYAFYWNSFMQGFVEIPEEEYQKFYHLWKIYSSSLIKLQNTLYKKIINN